MRPKVAANHVPNNSPHLYSELHHVQPCATRKSQVSKDQPCRDPTGEREISTFCVEALTLIWDQINPCMHPKLHSEKEYVFAGDWKH